VDEGAFALFDGNGDTVAGKTFLRPGDPLDQRGLDALQDASRISGVLRAGLKPSEWRPAIAGPLSDEVPMHYGLGAAPGCPPKNSPFRARVRLLLSAVEGH
jgi:hypothetical protein